MDDPIVLSSKDYAIGEMGYSFNIYEHFHSLPDIAKPLVASAQSALSKIERSLYSVPAFFNAVKAAIPEVTLQAILTDDQKAKLANGTIKLMTKKDGSLMANLVDPATKKLLGLFHSNR